MIRRFARRLRQATAGAVALETAILSLPLGVGLVSSLEFARLQWTENALQQVATATARCAGLRAVACSTAGEPRAFSSSLTASYATTLAASWSVPLVAADVTVNGSTTCQSVTGMAQISITYRFNAGMLTLAGVGARTITAVACHPVQS